MDLRFSRRNCWNGAIGLSLLGYGWFCEVADSKPMQAHPGRKEPVSGSIFGEKRTPGKPMQTHPGLEEPVSGSFVAGKKILIFLVHQKQLSIDLQNQDGSQYHCTLSADQALLSLLSTPGQDFTHAPNRMSELFGMMAAIVERSTVTGKNEIVAALEAAAGKPRK